VGGVVAACCKRAAACMASLRLGKALSGPSTYHCDVHVWVTGRQALCPSMAGGQFTGLHPPRRSRTCGEGADVHKQGVQDAEAAVGVGAGVVHGGDEQVLLASVVAARAPQLSVLSRHPLADCETKARAKEARLRTWLSFWRLLTSLSLASGRGAICTALTPGTRP
jgi:hypothetical protein